LALEGEITRLGAEVDSEPLATLFLKVKPFQPLFNPIITREEKDDTRNR